MSHHDWGDDATPLVLDASVLINIAACGIGTELLTRLSSPIHVSKLVADEIAKGAMNGHEHAAALTTWTRSQIVDLVDMSDRALGYYEILVAGSALTTLDDGEAATIALAADISAVAIIDEAKGTHICRAQFPATPCSSTIDLFLHPNVSANTGDGEIGDAIFYALIKARMRVPTNHLDNVVRLIDPDRARQCLSLPSRFRRPPSDDTE